MNKVTIKRKNPYQILLDDIKDWCRKLGHRRTKIMWYYPKNRLTEGWKLVDLYERTRAAEQLGYDVQIEANDSGLQVVYIEKVPAVPYRWE